MNHFLAYAAKMQPWAEKKKRRAAELVERKMHRAQKKAMIKAVNERDMLMRLWKKWRIDLVNAELDGPYAPQLQALIDFLNKLELRNERQLLKLVRAGPWLTAHKDIRFLVLRLIDARLIKLREKQELPPFDDAIPGKPLTTFQIIRGEFQHA